jgi:hypothetical protein
MLDPLSERFGPGARGQPRAVPNEELDADLGLECPHALADRRRRDSKLHGRPGKITVPDTGGQDPQ